VENGVVFDGGGDEVCGVAVGGFGGEDAEEGEVVALGAAGGEDDLGVEAVEEAGYGGAGLFDCSAGLLALLVDGASVAVVLHPEGTHGFEDFG
jgi:hypothetical protein